jgi:hypothetical protein
MTDQADNATRGADLTTRTAAACVTKYPQGTREETEKEMRNRMTSIIKKATLDGMIRLKLIYNF